jgi:hypothetical protein
VEEAGQIVTRRAIGSLQDAVGYYLERARSGDDRGGAFFGLIELNQAVLPFLEAAYRSERDGAIRALLVEVIWQHRQHTVVPFLFEALKDSDEETWMQALDGLVALASPDVRDGLESAIRLAAHEKQREWFQEALDQIQQALAQVDSDAPTGLH